MKENLPYSKQRKEKYETKSTMYITSYTVKHVEQKHCLSLTT